jgi:hypothetical protein
VSYGTSTAAPSKRPFAQIVQRLIRARQRIRRRLRDDAGARCDLQKIHRIASREIRD